MMLCIQGVNKPIGKDNEYVEVSEDDDGSVIFRRVKYKKSVEDLIIAKKFFTKSFMAIMLVAIIVFLLPQASANLGTFKQDSCVSLRVLSNCSIVNITEVSNSNQTFIINQRMTKLGQTFNYTFCNASKIDVYSFSWNDICIDCSQGGCGNSFEVSATGKNLTIAKAVTYILIFVVGLLIFIGLLIVGIALPISNKKDEMTGYILYTSNLKYLKLVSLGIAYAIIIFLSYFSWMVCYSYLDMDFVSDIFKFMFFALMAGLLPVFILFTYLTIANLVQDSKIADMLSRGLRIK